jgi:hypothetical protein
VVLKPSLIITCLMSFHGPQGLLGMRSAGGHHP